MSDGFAQIPPDSTGKKVDAASLDVGADSVLRQRMIIADNSATAQYATVTGGALLVNVSNNLNISAMPAISIGSVAISGTAIVAGVVNISAMPAITGTVNLSGTALCAVTGTVNISGTPSVVLAAGTALIGDLNAISRTVQVAIGTAFTINNISATVAVSGLVGLTAGTAVIGDINAISRTVQVAIGTPFTLNNISATTIVAGVVSLGAGTNLIGAVSLAAGTANIGILNNISATVIAQVGPTAIISASHGPKCVTASTSSNVTLIASPGAGANVYITQLMVGNYSSTLTRARIGTSASIATVVYPCAASGGGFVLNFDPPWKLSASEAAVCSVKPNVSEVYFTVNFYIA
jgi:hypothetical protein